jgi:PAS domain S-box
MHNTHALVVDNSPVIRRFLEYVLVAEGCSVQLADNGLDALDCIMEQRPDIIFTDLIMPKIDGEKFGYVIRNTPEFKNIFLVILSGVILENDDAIGRINADVCIAKGPIITMRAHVTRALERFRANQRDEGIVHGLEGLYPREITSELLISKKHREAALACMTEGVVELNHEGRIVMVNNAVVSLLNVPEERMLGRHLVTLMPQPAGEMIAAWIERLNTKAEFAPFSFPYDDPIQIGERQVTCNLVPVKEDTKFFIIGILQDITYRKELEQRQLYLEKELQRSRKLEAMSVMATGISHDFNNLMTIISGNVDMAHYVNRDEKVSHLLNEAGKAIHLTTRLIRQFTTFSDNYLPQKSQVRLGGLVSAVLEQELDSTGVTFHVACSDEGMTVAIDPTLVGQVFSNLTSNAIAAMDGTGHINVTIDRVNGNMEAVETGRPLPDGELIRIVFCDSGPGVAPDILDQVFDPYCSTKQKGAQKGMGLGLTIVHGTVKKHGGAVWIETPPDGGCAVRLYLPFQATARADSRDRAQKGIGRRILLMDDKESTRLIGKEMFEQCGCTVTPVSCSVEAMDVYRRQLVEGRRVDLTLLNLSSDGDPDGGATTARAITVMDPGAVVVGIVDGESDEVVRQYDTNQFAAVLTKPFSIDSVEDLVDRFL